MVQYLLGVTLWIQLQITFYLNQIKLESHSSHQGI